MNEHETEGEDAMQEAFDAVVAWETEHRSKKRRAALVIVGLLAAGFVAAAVVGHAIRAEASPGHVQLGGHSSMNGPG